MQGIAELSDVSTKTLYNLFGNRDLLLLEVASQSLIDLEASDAVTGAEPGLPRLLAFTAGAMRQFEEEPNYARAVISIIVRADLGVEDAYARMGPVLRFALQCLQEANERGELRQGLDLEELAYLVACNQWGVVLLWEKGLLGLDQLVTQVSLSHYLALTHLCRGRRKTAMKKEMEALLESTVGAPAPRSRQRRVA